MPMPRGWITNSSPAPGDLANSANTSPQDGPEATRHRHVTDTSGLWPSSVKNTWNLDVQRFWRSASWVLQPKKHWRNAEHHVPLNMFQAPHADREQQVAFILNWSSTSDILGPLACFGTSLVAQTITHPVSPNIKYPIDPVLKQCL